MNNKDIWMGKGSWRRPLSISKEELDRNIERIFGRRLTWLELKKIGESWRIKNV